MDFLMSTYEAAASAGKVGPHRLGKPSRPAGRAPQGRLGLTSEGDKFRFVPRHAVLSGVVWFFPEGASS